MLDETMKVQIAILAVIFVFAVYGMITTGESIAADLKESARKEEEEEFEENNERDSKGTRS